MASSLWRFAARYGVHPPMAKATSPDDVWRDVHAVIRNHLDAWAVELFGSVALPPDRLAELLAAGVIPPPAVSGVRVAGLDPWAMALLMGRLGGEDGAPHLSLIHI